MEPDFLEQHDKRLTAAFAEAVPEALIVVTPDARILAANQKARMLFPRLKAPDLLAMHVRVPAILDGVARVAKSGVMTSVSWAERVPVERWFNVTITPVQDAPLQPSIVLYVQELTEARRVERMRVDFIANASHELRTPLASLLGFVETLQGAAKDDPKARATFLNIMRDQGQRMARLVDDLLSLSKIEQNLHVRPEKPVDLVALVRHVADSLGMVAADAHVTLNIAPHDPVIVPGDRDELLRVIENLLENAIKYGARDDGTPTQVDVTLSVTTDDVRLDVRDYGRGIAREHLPRLTERFYRVDPGQSRAKGGTGLGLAIVKHIVAHHRGRLNIDSELGAGTKFSVTLPLHKTTQNI